MQSVLDLKPLLDLLQPEALHVLLAHLELLNLARDRCGESLDKSDMLRDLEVRDLALAKLLDVVDREVGAAGPSRNNSSK